MVVMQGFATVLFQLNLNQSARSHLCRSWLACAYSHMDIVDLAINSQRLSLLGDLVASLRKSETHAILTHGSGPDQRLFALPLLASCSVSVSSHNTRAEAKGWPCYESCVRVTFSCSNLHSMVNPITENPWSRSATAGAAGVHLCACNVTVRTGVGKPLYMWPSRPIWVKPQGFSSRTLTNVLMDPPHWCPR